MIRGQVRLRTAIAGELLAQRGHLFAWAPVCLGLGIGLYFALPSEPGSVDWALLAGFGLTALVLSRLLPVAVAPIALGLALVAGGIGMGGARAALVAEPVLGFRYYGPIEGRVVTIDRSGSDALRLTLDRVVLRDMAPDRTPARVRVSLHGDQGWIDPAPGMTVILTGHLSPPGGPVEPGDFDFRRMAWFDRLGAVGYTRTPVLMAAPAEEGHAGLAVHRIRMALSKAIRNAIPGDPGGYAAAVMTGDRSGLTQSMAQAMRDANLYHLIAISGMHMGMLVAVVFGFVRTGVALIPPLALRYSGKKIAALAALPVAAGYLALAGRAVATERAFVMVAVMLVAVLLDRRALSIRSVAVAALIVLALRPETLLNPGFHMSFAAVVALVAAWGNVRDLPLPRLRRTRMSWMIPVLGLLFTSLIAGLATAPFAAGHFNRVAHYGLVANLLAVPAMGLVVMPGAVLYAVLAPLGLEAPAVWIIETGARWILAVATEVASWPGASSAVVSPPGVVLPLLAVGALMVMLWQGRGRWAGVAPVLAAAALWGMAERPVLLVADTGALIGVMTDAGRVLSKPTGDSFAAANWLENDGTRRGQEAAAALPGMMRDGRLVMTEAAGLTIAHVTGKTALAALEGCNGADLLITNVEDEIARPCPVFDAIRLRETGALSLQLDRDGRALLRTVAERAGDRPWVQRAARDPAPLLLARRAGTLAQAVADQ